MADFYTVSQITGYIKSVFDRDFVLRRICIRGEVSNCKYHSSGHIYFTLKDSLSQINCVMFAGARAELSFKIEDGQQIDASGQITVFEKNGSYQLYVRSASPAGAGELYEKFLRLKDRLEEMGMFDPLYKKEIPPYCMNIGIVTAPTGAAVRDIINISKRRNPYVRLVLYPALVQGRGAGESIVKGIKKLDGMGLDVIIVGRGGGSIEDLWAFNEEEVANAIFDAQTPIISAVGHETDFTIADFAADLRAPTPSAAAELANFEFDEFKEQLSAYVSAFNSEMQHRLSLTRQKADTYTERLRRLSPENVLINKKDRLSDIKMRMNRAVVLKTKKAQDAAELCFRELNTEMHKKLSDTKHRAGILISRLDGASPLKKMSGGFGYISDSEKKAVKSVRDISAGDVINAYVRDGKITGCVISAEEISYEK